MFKNQADFSKGYVHDQLAQHKITFSPVANLRGEQKTVPCLVENAGKPLVTGKQAECYANYQIAIDMLTIDKGNGYTQDHYAAYLLRLKTAEAVRAHPDDPATVELIKQSTELSRKADDLFAGETMRGLLLTAYGFNLLVERGGQAALTCFVAGGALLVAMFGSFAIAVRAKREDAFDGLTDSTSAVSAPRQPAPGRRGEPVLTGMSGHRG